MPIIGLNTKLYGINKTIFPEQEEEQVRSVGDDDESVRVLLPIISESYMNGAISGATAEVLPAVTTTNNGQVLTVVEGDWATANIPDVLPDVSSTDNGQVLTVVEGSWAPASVPVNTGTAIMTGTWNDGACTFDMTFQEIYDAIDAGKIVFAVIPTEDAFGIMLVSSIEVSSTAISVKFGENTLNGTEATDYPVLED